ncbi:DMT family transporter [Neotabrizicola shimadae]|uniref:DMT family transporter n=1 Tax=Neotabrizicola shimadae TaxID=2807096 RepID=A0A8G0ZS64_9RHOB|nr:DMT family transporter [Neotabrizicola shimadae]QYZ69484.1 DMT family transporter [Neotabrizicola shimadae]
MDLRAILMGVAFAAMWSSAFATARIIVAGAPPLHALALRFLISGLLAIAVARALGQTWRMDRAQARAVILFGLCQNALYLGLNFIALQSTPAALASIIASTMPLLVAFLGWAFGGQRLPPLGVLGLALGLCGVSLIMGTRLTAGADPQGILLCIGGALALAVATLTLRGASASGNLLMVVGLQMLVGAAALLPVAIGLESWRLAPSLQLAAAFAWQILVPGLAATMIWFALVRRLGTVRAASFHFLNPAFGVLFAALLLGESIGPWDVAGVLVVTLGIVAVQRARAA